MAAVVHFNYVIFTNDLDEPKLFSLTWTISKSANKQ